MFVQRLIWRVFQADENIFVDSFTEKVCAVQAFIAGCVCRADRDDTKFKQIIRHTDCELLAHWVYTCN